MNNFVYSEENSVTAKTCGSKEKNRQKITHIFSEEFHCLFMDKKYLFQAEIEACERLFKYVTNDCERAPIEKEIAVLKAADDLKP
jgi:hypothetical protein